MTLLRWGCKTLIFIWIVYHVLKWPLNRAKNLFQIKKPGIICIFPWAHFPRATFHSVLKMIEQRLKNKHVITWKSKDLFQAFDMIYLGRRWLAYYLDVCFVPTGVVYRKIEMYFWDGGAPLDGCFTATWSGERPVFGAKPFGWNTNHQRKSGTITWRWSLACSIQQYRTLCPTCSTSLNDFMTHLGQHDT